MADGEVCWTCQINEAVLGQELCEDCLQDRHDYELGRQDSGRDQPVARSPDGYR